MPIQKLDAITSEHINAGEIVENPSSVVKELVENSLDAGAKRIKVSLKNGGLEEISVVDDGSGIHSKEVRLALERHATSKIICLDDLENIKSLGFRGEALPSIASVSELEITTRHEEEDTGINIILKGNQEVFFKEVGFPAGTRVTVKDLFFNTPARLKFLKGIPAETARVTRTIHLLALSRPDVSFSLVKETGVLLETYGDGNLLNVILSIYGNILGRELIPLNFHSGDFSLNGFVSNPSFSRNSRNYQVFYVNKRYVRSQLMKEVLDKAFSKIITSRRYPAAFLFLTLPPQELDVNVHPAKVEVRFREEDAVKKFLGESLGEAFSPSYFIPRQNKTEIASLDSPQRRHEPEQRMKQSYFNVHYTEKPGEKEIVREEGPQACINYEFLLGKATPHAELFTKKVFEGPISGQIFGTYIILQEGEDLVLVDQHAAHERVIWEKVQDREMEKDHYVQEILPIPLELPTFIIEILQDKIGLLKEIGLEMEQFGNNTFIIRAVPFFLKDVFTAELFMDIFENLSGSKMTETEFQKETLLQLSCKAAVKANKLLTLKEMESLLEQLSKCDNPYFCPHGRPVMVKIGKAAIEKYFKRQG
ncbi:MAG: DNA mismatch repair endonuclease MutL [Bacillota bacterium]|nr:DNA mismatch repair endonuclease MutL [Bacillota bacterium]